LCSAEFRGGRTIGVPKIRRARPARLLQMTLAFAE
jgi:hypothetical protein